MNKSWTTQDGKAECEGQAITTLCRMRPRNHGRQSPVLWNTARLDQKIDYCFRMGLRIAARKESEGKAKEERVSGLSKRALRVKAKRAGKKNSESICKA